MSIARRTADPLRFMAGLETLASVDYSLCIKAGVHFTLCGGELTAHAYELQLCAQSNGCHVFFETTAVVACRNHCQARHREAPSGIPAQIGHPGVARMLWVSFAAQAHNSVVSAI